MSISEKQTLKADRSGGFKMDGYWIWCGSVLKSGDGYHMHAARWSKEYPMFVGYIYKSEIVHAFSRTMCGPYQFVEKVLPSGDGNRWDGRMAHNPTVLQYGKQYLLYYIASTYPEKNPAVAAHDPALTEAVYKSDAGSGPPSPILPRDRGKRWSIRFWNRDRDIGTGRS